MMAANPPATPASPWFMKILCGCGFILIALVVLVAFAWAYGALHFDGPAKWLAVAQAVALLAVFVFVKRWGRKLAIFGGWFAIVLT